MGPRVMCDLEGLTPVKDPVLSCIVLALPASPGGGEHQMAEAAPSAVGSQEAFSK